MVQVEAPSVSSLGRPEPTRVSFFLAYGCVHLYQPEMALRIQPAVFANCFCRSVLDRLESPTLARIADSLRRWMLADRTVSHINESDLVQLQ
jgi:hypothetical protein